MRILISLIITFCMLTACRKSDSSILVFAGTASQPATEKAAIEFEKQTGIKIKINFGGSGSVLSQMILSKQGDIYFPGSSDFMEIAKRKNVIINESEKIVAYLIPCINVQKGNPKNINSLNDLLKPNVKLAIANPEYVCLGRYAVEIITHNFSDKQINYFKNNLINYTGSCSKTAAAISLKTVDAVLGWNVFEYWDPKRIQNIQIKGSEIVRIGYMPIAISSFSQKVNEAQQFIDFITKGAGKLIFEKHNYFMNTKNVFNFIGSEKQIGGIYNLPNEWKN